MAINPDARSKPIVFKDDSQQRLQLGQLYANQQEKRGKDKQDRVKGILEFDPNRDPALEEYFTGRIAGFKDKWLPILYGSKPTIDQRREMGDEMNAIARDASISIQQQQVIANSFADYEKNPTIYDKATTEQRFMYARNPRQHAIDNDKLEEYNKLGPAIYRQNYVLSDPLKDLAINPIDYFRDTYNQDIKSITTSPVVSGDKPSEDGSQIINTTTQIEELAAEDMSKLMIARYETDETWANIVNAAVARSGGEFKDAVGYIQNMANTMAYKKQLRSGRSIRNGLNTGGGVDYSGLGVGDILSTAGASNTEISVQKGDKKKTGTIRSYVPFEAGAVNVDLVMDLPNYDKPGSGGVPKSTKVKGYVAGVGVADYIYVKRNGVWMPSGYTTSLAPSELMQKVREESKEVQVQREPVAVISDSEKVESLQGGAVTKQKSESTFVVPEKLVKNAIYTGDAQWKTKVYTPVIGALEYFSNSSGASGSADKYLDEGDK